jgi:ABC-type polysaccharide/polyol phosphate transport system ATPase subunit
VLDANFAPRRLDRDQVEEKYEEISDFAGLGGLIHLPKKAARPAMYRRFGVAMAMSSNAAKQTRSWRHIRSSAR